MPDFSVEQIDLIKLHRVLVEHFDMSELRLLIFRLRIEYDVLEGENKVNKAQKLITYLKRRGRLEELVMALLEERPNIDLNNFLYPVESRAIVYEDNDEPPFKGLHYFDTSDAHLFFGREVLTQCLFARLFLQDSKRKYENFLAIVGAPRSGKSSLVRAGLIPLLNSNNMEIHLITPTSTPLKTLAQSLTRDSDDDRTTAKLMDSLAEDARVLDLRIDRRLKRRKCVGDAHLLLVVDQFEELFTVCKNETMRDAFIENLLAAVFSPQASSNRTVIITLRADFYEHCARYDSLRQALAQHQEYIGPMTEPQLREAIEKPAEQVGLIFETGLVELLLRDVGDKPETLPLLSHLLLETWRRRRGNKLTLDGYRDAGLFIDKQQSD